jgi:hypothetical protein
LGFVRQIGVRRTLCAHHLEMLMFQIGSEYTRRQIHDALGGSLQSYLPTVRRQVVAACLKLELNPRAPNEVLCGTGEDIAAAGASLAQQREPIPVFLKRGTNRWEFRGRLKVVEAHSSGPKFNAMLAGSGRLAQDVTLAIRLG